jgi:hypothetical protein
MPQQMMLDMHPNHHHSPFYCKYLWWGRTNGVNRIDQSLLSVVYYLAVMLAAVTMRVAS